MRCLGVVLGLSCTLLGLRMSALAAGTLGVLDANGLVEVSGGRRMDGSGSCVDRGDARHYLTHPGGGLGQSFLVDYVVSCKIVVVCCLFIYISA